MKGCGVFKIDTVWEVEVSKVPIVPLNEHTIRRYGRILSESTAEPSAREAEFLYWSQTSVLTLDQPLSTGLLVCHPRKPYLSQLERHVDTPEVLVALDGDSIICLAAPDEEPAVRTPESLAAFKVTQGQAFVMNSGTWHWIPFPTEQRQTKFLVAFATDTESNDLEVVDLPEGVQISL